MTDNGVKFEIPTALGGRMRLVRMQVPQDGYVLMLSVDSPSDARHTEIFLSHDDYKAMCQAVLRDAMSELSDNDDFDWSDQNLTERGWAPDRYYELYDENGKVWNRGNYLGELLDTRRPGEMIRSRYSNVFGEWRPVTNREEAKAELQETHGVDNDKRRTELLNKWFPEETV